MAEDGRTANLIAGISAGFAAVSAGVAIWQAVRASRAATRAGVQAETSTNQATFANQSRQEASSALAKMAALEQARHEVRFRFGAAFRQSSENPIDSILNLYVFNDSIQTKITVREAGICNLGSGIRIALWGYITRPVVEPNARATLSEFLGAICSRIPAETTPGNYNGVYFLFDHETEPREYRDKDVDAFALHLANLEGRRRQQPDDWHGGTIKSLGQL